MNILYINGKKGWGGVVSWMYKTAVGLEKRGHKVWIISNKNSSFTRNTPPKIRLIPKTFGMDYNPFLIAYLIGFIKKNKIDVVVTNIQKEVAVGGIAAKICGIPNIRRIGNEFDFGKKSKVRINHRLFVDHCLAPCQFTVLQSLKRASLLTPEDFSVVYHGRNIQEFEHIEILEQREKWGLSDRDFVIGITGKLVKNKAVDHLILVFHKILPKYPKLKLVITGKGTEEESLKNLAKKLGIQEKVIFSGFTTTPMLSAAAYDIAVMCTKYESIPNVLIEYLALGKPVVITDVSGISEVIVDGENGLLYEYGNLVELEQKLTVLIEKPEIRKKLSDNALKTIQSKFSADKMIDELEIFYKRMIKN